MRRLALLFVSLVLALSAVIAPAFAGKPKHPDMMLGPGEAGVHGIGKEAVMRLDKRFGYVYISGKHNQHLTITYLEEKNSLRFRDTRTPRLKSAPKHCKKEPVKKGISVVCWLPKKFQHHSFIQVWPRLGNDYTDARTLPHKFRVWALLDDGADVFYGGAGNDFTNGAMGNDRIFGGKGNDFLRSGPGRDFVRGGPGKDKIGRE